MNYKKLILFIIFISFAVVSCKKVFYPPTLITAEKILTIYPDSAYHLLRKMQNQIKEEPEEVQMHYQMILFRAKDLCYLSNQTDSVIGKAINYYIKKGDEEHLMLAYYCTGCIYRDGRDAPRALGYYQKALDHSENSTQYELVTRIYAQIDSIQIYSHDQAMQQMQSLYNYNRTEKKNQQLTIDNQHKERLIAQLLFIIFVLCLLGLFYRQWNRKKRHQREKALEELNRQYLESEELIDENNCKIEELKRKLAVGTNRVAEQHIAKLQMDNTGVITNIKRKEESLEKFRQSNIFFIFRHVTNHGILIYSHQEMEGYLEELKETVDTFFDNFGRRLYACYPQLSQKEIMICYFIKAEIPSNDMAIILARSKQAISNIRSRINKKCLKGIATTKQFEAFIKAF